MRKHFLLVNITILMLFLTISCSKNTKLSNTGNFENETTSKAQNQHFKTIVDQELTSIDPAQNTNIIGSVVINNIYEGLYRLDPSSLPKPAGATELAEVSDDGLTYKFKLRKEAKWSNGDPITSKDYVYGWRRVVDPATNSEYARLHSPIKNARDIVNGKKDKSQLGIKALSDYELEVTLEEPTHYLDHLLTLSAFFPQHEATVIQYGDFFALKSENAIYNGPFILTDFDGPGTDLSWTYLKNDSYWDKSTVNLEKITADVVKECSTALNLYLDNQADDIRLTGEFAQQMLDNSDLILEKQAGLYYFELNQRSIDSTFRNKDLRLAISYALDRNSLVTQLLGDGSIAASGLVPSGMLAHPEKENDFSSESGNHLTFNEKKALSHWKKALNTLKKEQLTLEILTSDSDFSKKIVEFYQASLENLLPGLTIKTSIVPLTIRIDRCRQGDFDIVLNGWIADYADPSSFLDLFETDSSANNGYYSNTDYDNALRSARTEHATQPVKRFEDLLRAEEIIMDDMGVIPLYQIAETRLRRRTIKDLVIHSAGAHYDYKWAYISTN